MVKSLEPRKVLEIGIGNKTVSNYLRNNGIKIDTCDFDPKTCPDFVADIRKLPFDDDSYDTILACEILEHLPWEEFDIALSEICRVSKKHIIISIPYSSTGIEIIFKFPLIRKFLKKPFINFFIRIPFFFKTIVFNGEHYWEMGTNKYPKNKIRFALKKYFNIQKETRPILNHYHYFFTLTKKQSYK